MELNKENLDLISSQYGESFYILDTEQFVKNYNNLLGAFRKYYSNSHIAYSYKTNYTPRLCYLINSMGGFAEIVSDMEGEIAYKIGMPVQKLTALIESAQGTISMESPANQKDESTKLSDFI